MTGGALRPLCKRRSYDLHTHFPKPYMCQINCVMLSSSEVNQNLVKYKKQTGGHRSFLQPGLITDRPDPSGLWTSWSGLLPELSGACLDQRTVFPLLMIEANSESERETALGKGEGGRGQNRGRDGEGIPGDGRVGAGGGGGGG